MASIDHITAREVFELLRPDLQRVEEELGDQTLSDVRTITEIGRHLQASGGKRLRPALLLLAAKLCGYDGASAVRLGAVVELIHTATLIHDDIIDGADIRRGQPSTNSCWGNHMSVLAGDWLYMQAFNIALADRNFKILDILIGLTQIMVEGELVQLTLLRKLDVTEDEYLELAYRKTACLFSACLRLGAVLGRRPEEEEARLGSYGANLGMAFQLVDDVLDLTASEEELGKPTCSDLREGKVTFPLICLLSRSTPEERTRVARVLRDGALEPAQVWEIHELLDRYDALRDSRAKAQHFADSALSALHTFPDALYRDGLRSLAEFIVERQY